MNILHIEEDKNIRMLIKEAFKDLNINYIETSTAEEAKRIINSKKIDLILLDLKLPGKKQGIDLLEELKEMKFILITANSDSLKDEFKKKYPHVKCVFTKPFQIEQLLIKIKKIIKESHKK